MLSETRNIQQIENEPKRRWFSNDYFDLIVWFDAHEEMVGFQLCYDIAHRQRALTWLVDEGFSHGDVDEGESELGKPKESPTIAAGGEFDKNNIGQRFKESAANIDKMLAREVYHKILTCDLAGR